MIYLIFFLEKKETKIKGCEIMPIIILPVVSRHRKAKNLSCRLKKTNSPQTFKLFEKYSGSDSVFFLTPSSQIFMHFSFKASDSKQPK